MNYTSINLDLQGVVKRAYENLLYRSTFMNFLNSSYLGSIRQTGTPTIEVIKQSATTTNVTTGSPEIISALSPALATYSNKIVDLADLRLDYSFRVSYLMTQSGIEQAVAGQIELQDANNAFQIDKYGFNKFNEGITGAVDGSQANTLGQQVVWNPSTSDDYVELLNNLKMDLFNRNVYDGYKLGLDAVKYGALVSNLTSLLKYETMAGVEGVDRGVVGRAYGIDIFPVSTNAINDSNTKGYFASEIGTVGDAFFTQFNEYNGSYPGFPGYYCVEGVILFGADIVRPEAIIRLVAEAEVSA